MSPMNTINILALAAGALAVPYHGHGHVRRNDTSGWSSAPYATTNVTVLTSSSANAVTTVPVTTTATIYYASTSASASTESAVGSSTDSAAGSSTWSSASSYSVNPVSESACAGSTVTVTTKAYVTVTVPADGGSSSYVPSTGSVGSSVVSPVSSAGRSTRTVTSTVHITNSITLPASGSASMSANSTASSTVPAYGSSSTDVSPVQSSSSWAAPSYGSSVAYTLPVETSSITTAYDAPSQTSAPAYSSEWSSTSAPTWSSAWSSTATTSSAAATSSTASSSGTGKRGVSYNDASLTNCFLNNPVISWAYNWGSTSTGLNSALNFIPTLWGTASEWTNAWNTNAEAAIASGSTHLFSFNEPDMSSQSNLSPQDAAAGWKTYMQPFAGKAKLCAPAVTNGGGAMGLDWLAAFLEACTDCTIDCVNVHWYDSAEKADYFKSHVQNATDISGGKPVFVSEFAATGSDDEVSSFLGEVMPWMDGQGFIEGYAYFMVSDGRLVTGTEPSVIGKVYAGSS